MEGWMIDKRLASSFLPPRREKAGKKGYGRLLGVCGSESYRGAAVLAMTAAARSGAGLVELASVRPVTDAVAASLPECMFRVLPPCPKGGIARQALPLLAAEWNKATACLCGCGLGLSAHSRLLVKELVRSCPVPMVLDADALNVLSEAPEALLGARAPVVVTPHHGEMERLSGREVAGPEESARRFAEKYRVTVILKGSLTVVAHPDGSAFVHDRDNSGLAKGGSGDVLAGLTAGLLAQGMEAKKAACLAVYVHGRAGMLARQALGQRGMLPHDVAERIPAAFLEIE